MFRLLSSILALLVFAPGARAHRQWLLPSTTVLSGEGQVISVEGAISNDLFYPNHVALPLAATGATAPSGKKLELLSATEGKIRSSFELLLPERGTYRIATVNDMMFASWEEAGETKRMRATPAAMAEKNLSGLSKLSVTRYLTRVETYVTCGAPTPVALSGAGLEFEFTSHPNDLRTGESAAFRVLLDGQPLANTEVSMVRGDDRFLDQKPEFTVTSDATGLVTLHWPGPGRYWLNASAKQSDGDFKGKPLHRGAAYCLTLEVFSN